MKLQAEDASSKDSRPGSSSLALTQDRMTSVSMAHAMVRAHMARRSGNIVSSDSYVAWCLCARLLQYAAHVQNGVASGIEAMPRNIRAKADRDNANMIVYVTTSRNLCSARFAEPAIIVECIPATRLWHRRPALQDPVIAFLLVHARFAHAPRSRSRREGSMENQKRLLEEASAAKATNETMAAAQGPTTGSEKVWRLSQTVAQSAFSSWGGDSDGRDIGRDGGREDKRSSDAAMVCIGGGGGGAGCGDSTTPPWFLMPDVIDVVLLRLNDGKDLAKCCSVNRLWQKYAGERSQVPQLSQLARVCLFVPINKSFKQALRQCASRLAGSEAVWEKLVIQRWCVHTLKRNNDGPLAQSQSNFWKKMYSQWHKSSRQPSSNFSGDRFPAFAMSLARNRKTRRFERFQAERFRQKNTAEEGHAVSAVQAAVWANCSHTPDCTTKIDDQGQCSLLGLHIVVQNYGQVPILLSPHDVMLRLKTGATCRPRYSTSTSPSRSNDAPAFLAVSRDGHVCEEVGELAGLTQVVLNQVKVMVMVVGTGSDIGRVVGTGSDIERRESLSRCSC